MNKLTAIQYLEERAADFYTLSDKIWENAEIRFREKQSVQDYAAFLKDEGFTITVGMAGLKTGFRAEWGSGKPVIGFLGEYDALPGMSQEAGVCVKKPLASDGNGHGCGHNLLGVGSLMGAIGLKHYLETERKSGTVVFFGCPAEEGGSGAWPVGTAAHSWQAVSCGKSDFAHKGMLYAGQIIAATAIDVCNNPEIIETACKQLKEKTGNHPYHCPIPPEITPELLASEIT